MFKMPTIIYKYFMRLSQYTYNKEFTTQINFLEPNISRRFKEPVEKNLSEKLLSFLAN